MIFTIMLSIPHALIAIGFLVSGVECFTPPAPASLTTQRIRNPPNHNGDAFTLNLETETTQDEKVENPASLLYYDDVPPGIVCARGVCVLPDDEDIDWSKPPPSSASGLASTEGEESSSSIVDKFLKSYLGPRLLLAFASILYGTNFPLGAMMNESLPPSAATSARMLLASLALSPFLFKLEPKLAPTALLCGCFTALGYITQSLSLVDTSPAKVAFIGERFCCYGRICAVLVVGWLYFCTVRNISESIFINHLQYMN